MGHKMKEGKVCAKTIAYYQHATPIYNLMKNNVKGNSNVYLQHCLIKGEHLNFLEYYAPPLHNLP